MLFNGEKTVEVKHGDSEQQIPLIVSPRQDFTSLFGLYWFRTPESRKQMNQISALETREESKKGIRNQFYTKYPKLLQCNKKVPV